MKRFRLNYIMLMVCASVILTTACKDELRKERSLSVTTESLSFAYGGGSQDVTIDTDYDKWSARPNVEWIKITKGEGMFTVTALPNDPGRNREAEIIITSGAKRHTIAVDQGGHILALSAAKLDFAALPAAGQTEIAPKEVTVEVINKPWTATKAKNAAGEEPAWFNFAQTGNKLSVSVKAYTYSATDPATREGKIYVQMDAYKDSVIIAQAREAAPPPEPDYKATIKYSGRFINANDVEFAVADVKLTGKDVAEVKVALVPGAWDEDIIEDILDGTITSVTLKADGSVQRQTSGPGAYTYVVLTFDKDKEYQKFAYDEFELADLSGESPWVSLGFCEYTDDLFVTLYSSDPDDIPTYEVEVFEHKDKPGLFRLKNAYGEDYPYNDPGDYDEDDVFIEINATDPDGVYINFQSMGVNWDDAASIYSMAAYHMDNGASLAKVKEDGHCGTYKNKVITFPNRKLLVAFEGDPNLYTGNRNDMWKVDMTKLSPTTKSAFRKSTSTANKISRTRSFSMEKAPLKMK